jgi:glycine dehydrogenase subunit 1
MLGKTGFVEVAKQCLSKAHYLRGRILSLAGYSAAFGDAPFFNEFAVRVRGGDAARVCAELEKKNIIAGLDLGRFDPARKDQLLVAVTERHTKADLEAFVACLDQVRSG